MKKSLLILITLPLLLISQRSNAQNDMINDYSMIGFHGGITLSNCIWNPTMKQEYLFNPVNFGITYTRYGKMFNSLPFFGLQVGLVYGQEGYKFKRDEDKDYTPTVEGATQARFKMIELPMMAHIHVDFWKMKLMANIGLYGGYRLAIERTGPGVSEELKNNFKDTDIRFDYGIKGGVGLGFMFDPIEIHITAMYKYSMSSLYQPDHMPHEYPYYGQYYYRYAYPNNIVISAGVHFQLTKRTGKTKAQLRKEAKEIVDKGLEFKLEPELKPEMETKQDPNIKQN